MYACKWCHSGCVMKKDIKDDIVFNKKKCSKSCLSYFVKNETNETYLSNLAPPLKKLYRMIFTFTS